MRTGKIVLLLAVLATSWPGAGGLGAHEALLQNPGAQATNEYGTGVTP